MKLTPIGISLFRSIGAEPVMLDLSKRVTVLVGQNDGGKSNVLLGLERVSSTRDCVPDRKRLAKRGKLS